MRLAPSELENLTPYQFNLMREGYAEDQKHQWERARFQAYMVYRMNVSDPVSIQEFLPLSDEDLEVKAIKIPEYTEQEKDTLHKLFNPGK